VSLTVTSDSGCVNSTQNAIEVFPQPTAEFDFTNACDNEDIILESTAVPNIGVISDYLWDVDADGINDYTTDSLGHTYTQDGFYTVEHIVNNSYGCSDTISKQVTVYALPEAAFTVDAVCEDTTTTFANNSLITPVDNDVISNYDWTFGNGNSSTNENPNHNYNNENIYNAQLMVTTNYGCKDSISHPVNVYPLPLVDFSVTSVCLNNENEFTNASTVSNAYTVNSITQWDWDFDDGSTSALQDPNNQYANIGSFNATLIAETNNGCIDSISKSVKVFDLPTADFDFTNACDNEDVSLESTAVPNEGTIADYFWDIENNGSIDYTVDPANHTYNQDGFYDVMHIVETSNGCRDTIVQEVTVYALPEAVFTVDAVCEDTTTTFANNSLITPVDNDVISNYDWTYGDGNSSTNENPTHNYNTENVYNAQLVITTNYGCKDSIAHPVNVYPLPAPDFTPTDVCLEDDSEFTDLTTVSNDYTTNSVVQWSWNFGDGTTSVQSNPDNEYANDGTFTAVLEVLTNHGCRADVTKTVTVHPLPVVSFSGVNLEGCSPVCPQISSTSTINTPSTISSYDWTLSDGSVYQGQSFSDCYYNTSGNTVFYGLSLVATSNEGCVSSHTENSYIEVYYNPTASFYFEPDESSVIDNEVEFFNTSVYADQYAWTFGNEGSSSQTNPIFTFNPEPGSHQIELVATTMQGCTDTALAVVDILDKIVFYVPNTFTPDNDKFNEMFQPVFTSGFDPQDFTLLIFNRWGELVFESHDASIGWDGKYGIEGDKIVKGGTYIWKIEFKETMSDKRHTHTGHVNLLK
jgi:gliding motility-associated-like protein